MKKKTDWWMIFWYTLCFTAGMLIAFKCGADETNETVKAEEVIGACMQIIEAEGWTAQDVADAIRSLRGLYLRDNASTEGRKRWHGQIVETAIDTNTLVRTTTYEDGEVFADEARVITPQDSANAKLAKLAATTNSGPERLSAARKRLLQKRQTRPPEWSQM